MRRLGRMTRPDLSRTSCVSSLARLGKVWGTVHYVHPFLAYQDLDWDAPLFKAIPKVEAAKTKEDYAAAVGEMLAALGDPATAIVSGVGDGKPTDGEGHPVWSWLDGKILVVRITNYLDLEQNYFAVQPKIERLKAEITKAEGVVFDLRALTPGTRSGVMTGVLGPIGNSLVSREAAGPAERSVLHSGYSPQTGMTSGGYFSAFVTSAAPHFVPAPGEAHARGVRGQRPLRATARRWYLQGQGGGALIAEGPISDAIFVTPMSVDLGEGLTVRVRTTEYVAGPDGPGEIRADIQVAPSPLAGPSIPSYVAALKFVRGTVDLTRTSPVARPSPAGRLAAGQDLQGNRFPRAGISATGRVSVLERDPLLLPLEASDRRRLGCPSGKVHPAGRGRAQRAGVCSGTGGDGDAYARLARLGAHQGLDGVFRFGHAGRGAARDRR